uniref:Ig-like domain-containing protein n=1 Tax=Lates calcarifer TaxID=8187 RepID=A0A4W6F248_LATCA
MSIHSKAQRFEVLPNGTLVIQNVQLQDRGTYICSAQSFLGAASASARVHVSSLPPVIQQPREEHLLLSPGRPVYAHCSARGAPPPTLRWRIPDGTLVRPSQFLHGNLFVLPNGTLHIRRVGPKDSGSYECTASNAVGTDKRTVRVETEGGVEGGRREGGGKKEETKAVATEKPSPSYSLNKDRTLSIPTSSKLNGNNGFSDNDGRIRDTEPNTGINTATSGSNPALRGDGLNGFNRPVSGITTQLGRSVISVGVSGVTNIGIKADNVGINRNGPDIVSSSSNNVGNSHSTARGESFEKSPGTNNNEVIAGRAGNDANTSRDNGRISGISRNVGVSSNVPSSKNSTNTALGVVMAVKQQALKGQTVLLPCPSQGSPPPRLAWLLPGNGVLPAPYYGSRLTVHRNGSLELRGVRASDAGTLVCVVRGERGETRTQVELEVSETQEEVRSPHRGPPAVEGPVQKSAGLIEATRSGASSDSAQSLSSGAVLPEKLHPRIQVTQKPLQRGLSLPAAPHPISPPPRSTGPASVPAVSTRTASLVSIINGETLRLPCPAPQTPGYPQGSLSWTMPSGKVLSRGESSDSGQYLVQEDGTLTVQQASVFDRGTYTCRSTSYDSSSVSVITVPVIVIAYPPRITTGPSPVTYTRPGVAVELPCLTIATPRATVTWQTPDLTQLRVMGQARIYGNRYLSPQGSLVIQNPTSRDTGFYRCTAKNVIGVDTKATYLHVI